MKQRFSSTPAGVEAALCEASVDEALAAIEGDPSVRRLGLVLGLADR